MADVDYALAITQDDGLEAPQQAVLDTGYKIVGTDTAAQGVVATAKLSDGLYIVDLNATLKTPAQVQTILEALVLKLQQGGTVWNTNLPGTPAFTDLPTGSWTAD